MTTLIRLIFISLGLFLTAGAIQAAEVSVTVPAENSVAGERILLGDIADISLLSPSGQALAEALARLDLGPAPGAGQTTVLRRSQIEMRLNSSRLDLASATLNLPEELRLTGRGQELSQAVLRQALENYLAENEPYQSGRFELRNVNFGPLPILPPGRAAYRFVPQRSANPASLAGTFLLAVDGRETARVRVTAQIELSIPVLVAARPLPKGQVLNPGDLERGLVPYAQAKGALTEPGPALGQTLKVTLNAGEPVQERHLTKSILVRRGDLVTMTATQGDLKVTATGQAKQDGALGDTIAIINLSSKKTVAGRVTGPNQVEIIF